MHIITAITANIQRHGQLGDTAQQRRQHQRPVGLRLVLARPLAMAPLPRHRQAEHLLHLLRLIQHLGAVQGLLRLQHKRQGQHHQALIQRLQLRTTPITNSTTNSKVTTGNKAHIRRHLGVRTLHTGSKARIQGHMVVRTRPMGPQPDQAPTERPHLGLASRQRHGAI